MLNAHEPGDDANDQGYLDTDHAFEASQAAANYYREARREARRPSKTDEIVIDRPAGHEKTFLVGSRELTVRYPLDYGYVAGLINPEDGEPADIFVGSGGPYCGRYMKGAVIDGIWAPDEHKWFTGLTFGELTAMLEFWCDQDSRLLEDHRALADRDAVLADMRAHCGFVVQGAEEADWGAKFADQHADHSKCVNFLLATLRDRNDEIRDLIDQRDRPRRRTPRRIELMAWAAGIVCFVSIMWALLTTGLSTYTPEDTAVVTASPVVLAP